MKSIKRNIALFLSIAMIAGFMVFPAVGAEEPKALSDMGLDELQPYFNITEVTTPVAPMAGTPSGSNETKTISIDFEKEIIYWTDGAAADENTPAFVSFDKGGKWSALKFSIGASATEGGDFSKFLNKESEIWLTSAIDKKTKQPQKAVTPKAATDTTPEVVEVKEATVWKFGKIAARPKLEKFSIDYSAFASVDGTDNGQWTLKGATGNKQKVTDLQIAYSADGKNLSGTESKPGAYGTFPAENDTEGKGINVTDPINEGKADKVNFLVRVAPTANSAGSKAKKFSASSLIKAPALKVDYKKEALKLKAGLVVTALTTVPDGEGVDPATAAHDTNVGAAINGIPFTGLDKAKHDKMIKEGLKIDNSKSDGTTLNYNKAYGVYSAATEKKPASVIQVISIANFSDIYEVDAALTIKGTSIALPKAYEAKLLSDAAKADVKWSNKIKATKSAVYVVRMKNTAKFDGKKNTTTGNVVSGNLLLDVLVGKDAKNKDAVLATTYIAKSGEIETASASDFAIYLPDAKSSLVTLKPSHDATDATKDILISLLGETVFGDFELGTVAATNGLTAPAYTDEEPTLALKATFADTTTGGEVDVTFVAKSEGAKAATAKIYVPTVKVTVESNNAPYLAVLAGKIASAITLSATAADEGATKTAVETAIGTELDSPVAGTTVTYAYSEYKAATENATGSIKVEVTIKRGEDEKVAKTTVTIPKSEA